MALKSVRIQDLCVQIKLFSFLIFSLKWLKMFKIRLSFLWQKRYGVHWTLRHECAINFLIVFINIKKRYKRQNPENLMICRVFRLF
ncbi:hypothetical protein C4F50_00425 [Flavobacterium sp. KB82]|uniref:Uncharacterized protein n=1 Tax=Flavobacterium hungaricum TaxID=2082725 RepID=A0ABR9TEB1_9FLAO|nr:hypothetical protein [Flavobacterium hungaricum]